LVFGGREQHLLAPADGKVYPTDLNNFGPSIGINWSPGTSGA
jgi:hypothetical protein